MNKNKKIILTIITVLVSTMLFVNKTKAITMWMQCTDSPNDVMQTDDDEFKNYNTFALINNVENQSSRHLVYNPIDFYAKKKPVYILYNYNGANKNGQDIGEICWYNTTFNGMQNCDDNYDSLISITELFNGNCPTSVYQTKGIETNGSVKGDFLVLSGKKRTNLSNTESLNDSELIIYGFQKADDDSYIDLMVEGYDSSGLYGYATTWQDWYSFIINLNMSEKDDLNDLIAENSYDDEYMSWTGMTQARRINKFGRDYFKLLGSKRPWLVGAVDDQKFKVVERKDGKSIMFRSDDNNNNFYNWVEEWYKEYDEQLSEQTSAKEKLDSNYKKTFDTAKEISDAVNSGKKYSFGNYTASQMIADLNEASKLLDKILSSESAIYETYDSNCNLLPTKTNDPASSLITKFNCDLFGVSSISKLPHGTNRSKLDAILLFNLTTAINKHRGSESSIETIRSDAEEMAKMFTIAIKYIEKNESVSGISSTELDNLVDKYTEMSINIGIEVIIDCEDLIGDDLRSKIGEYLNIVKLIVPILLIVFGIIDFTKAMFASDEEKMKKAQKDFATRIVIAIIFFFVPTIVDLILGLANKVWNFIEPSSCGIFNG